MFLKWPCFFRLDAERAPQLKAIVMLLSLEQICGSRLNYKLFHGFVRLTCSLSIALVFILVWSPHFADVWLRNTRLEGLAIQWFLFYSPITTVSLCIFESFWLRRTEIEMRALALDWLFVVVYLIVWGFGILKGFLSMPIF